MKRLLALLSFCCLQAFASPVEPRFPAEAAYLGQKLPGTKPVPFAPELLKAHPFLGRIAFSPDGLECGFTVSDAGFTTMRLFLTRFEHGAWTEPKQAPFTARFDKAGEPFFSADGRYLYFNALVASSGTGMDIWRVERRAGGWGEPQRLPAPINSDSNDFCFSQVADGTVYFHSKRGGMPQPYRGRLKADGQYSVEPLPAPVPSVGNFEGDPCVAPDGRFLVFYSSRLGGYGTVDLYVSFPEGERGWTRPVNLGADFNSPDQEYGATLSPDGRYLFFVRHSAQRGELYWVSTAGLRKPHGN